jgi:Mn2+/Fe2+ NRAMP family transporter
MTRARAVIFFAVMGPGVITGLAGNDAGGVATYTAAGADHGYALLWLLVLSSLGLVVVQEMSVRMAVVTGKGLSDLIRERFGVRWTILAMLALFIANGSNVIAEYAGIGASLGLLGIPPLVSIPVAALVIWGLIVLLDYRTVERALLVLVLAFIAYPVTAVLIGPDWGDVARAIASPTLPAGAGAMLTAVALIGTTITPYMLFYVQASIVDKGLDLAAYPYVRLDTWVGGALGGLFALFILIVAAAVLHPAGVAADGAEDAARALAPLAGPAAGLLFGIGLFGASLLGAVVMPLSTSYAICEAFGWESGISKRFSEAPIFMGLVTFLLAAGALAVVFVPQESLLTLIVVSQAVNGLLLPIILVFILRLAADRGIMGSAASGPLGRIAGWGIAALVSVLSLAYIAATALGIGS